MRDSLKCLIFCIATLVFSSCQQKTSSFYFNDIQSFRESYPCCNCKISMFVIDSIPSKMNSIMIAEPVAIELFNLRAKVDQFGGLGSIDSLPKKLRNKNRHAIYETIDQNEMYKCYTLPLLKEKKVNIIKGNFRQNTLTFSFQQKPYTIDVSYFNEMDGVIMYQTNKKPVLWTLDKFDKICTMERFLNCYYD